ncbi:MAG: Tol-Pal system subunit TolQ, partial [Desulfobacterales bacterium]
MNPAKIDIFHMILNAGLMVQFVLLLLLFFSVTSWAIMIMKYRYIKRAFSESAEFIDFFWKSRNLSNAFSKAKMLQGSPVARIFRVGYVELKKSSRFRDPAESGSVNSSGTESASLGSRFTGIGNVKRALRRAINAETTRMTRMVP